MIRYLALGDSYTIGEAVDKTHSFPHQLLYGQHGLSAEDGYLKIIAVTGWTTSDLLEAIEKEKPLPGEWSFITLLIGVNNQYQGNSFEVYEREFSILFSKAVELMSGDASKVIVISIPDYGVTPFAVKADREKITKEIHQYNIYSRKMAEHAGSPYVSITDISLKAAEDEELITDDGLHPSGVQYRLWVQEIIPNVKKIINNG